MDEVRLVVCVNERLGPGKKSCAGSGSRELIQILQQKFKEEGIDWPIVEQVCLGRCEEGIAMRIAPGGPFFTQVSQSGLDKLIGEFKAYRLD